MATFARMWAPLLLALAVGCTHAQTKAPVSPDAGGVTPPPGENPPPPPPPGQPDATQPTPPPPADGSTPPPPPADAAPTGPPTPGASATVNGFSGAHVYWVGSMDNKRTIDATVAFPPMPQTYERINLKFTLRCPPTGGCDFWDRRGYLGIVHKDGDKEGVVELLRFMTPYRVGASWTIDVTGLRPLLSGDVTLRLFIDTWVGPGHPQGAGWLVDATFELTGGTPARLPIAVIPLWDETRFDYGDPAKPVAAAVPPRPVTIPAGSTAVELRSFITGHGQGNLGNCAEFCQRNHAFKVGEMRVQRLVWRADCATTSAPNQAGNFKSPRAGWCPGADVLPWVADVTAATRTPSVTVSYDVDPYVNTCRPDSPMCGGCALGTGCAFDNGAHTNPNYSLSAVLIVYR
jgi:hypothetical protein